MKTVIIGGVAAGAGAAARLRRLDEQAEIILLERGDYISYANCGLPYHIGGSIAQRDSLMVMTPEKFTAWFNVDVRTGSEVTAIDRENHNVIIKRRDGTTYTETYEKLVIATGSSPVTISLPGIDDPRVLRLWTVPDMDEIVRRIEAGAKRAVVVGAGFIGLETAENLRERGLEVTIVELFDQVLPTLDKEMTTPLSVELNSVGISQRLGRKVVSLDPQPESLKVTLDNGEQLAADLVVMSIGVKPNSEIAAAAGLQLGPRGHIVVDGGLQTSDPDIYAAGDVIEVDEPVLCGKTAIPLAGPANRQARIVADNIVGRNAKYCGSYGASILKIGNMGAASVGLTERRLKQLGHEYEKVYIHPLSNAKYYPGWAQISLKLLFDRNGKILGAQAVGGKGVDKTIGTISVAMQSGLKVEDLAELELAYAPPFNSAKDPVNFAGMTACNVLNGDTKIVHADAIPSDALLLDIREEAELALGEIPGAVVIPMSTFRKRLNEIDKTKHIVVFCQVGLRGYIVERALRQLGFNVSNLSGGVVTWKHYHPDPLTDSTPKASDSTMPKVVAEPQSVVDVRTLACPGPVVTIKQHVDAMAAGDTFKLLAAPSFAPDLASWLASSGNEQLSLKRDSDKLEAIIRKNSATGATTGLSCANTAHEAAIVVFSNDLDKTLAALILACGLASSGAKVGMFFTFWGLTALRKKPAPRVRKNLISRMFGMMLPKGANKLVLSKMHMSGMGTAMMKQVMAKKGVLSLPELLKQARALGVRFIACDMAMDVMGITREELIDVDEVAGVARFAELARTSNNTLFI
ncbi:MAG: FAD-dependent oxidoreductase [Lentisphaerae bacterium]|nr:FAD-dependent oxidoreductase [Lentisphaerota bacterium]